jgi:hypothetical protein
MIALQRISAAASRTNVKRNRLRDVKRNRLRDVQR